MYFRTWTFVAALFNFIVSIVFDHVLQFLSNVWTYELIECDELLHWKFIRSRKGINFCPKLPSNVLIRKNLRILSQKNYFEMNSNKERFPRGLNAEK